MKWKGRRKKDGVKLNEVQRQRETVLRQIEKQKHTKKKTEKKDTERAMKIDPLKKIEIQRSI
jgi:hypothetical protein